MKDGYIYQLRKEWDKKNNLYDTEITCGKESKKNGSLTKNMVHRNLWFFPQKKEAHKL